MLPHVARADTVALWIGFLLGLAALLGGLQNLVGLLRGQGARSPGKVPKYDSGTALVGIVVGSLFIWITAIYGRPEKRAASVEAQRAELRESLEGGAANMPVNTFLAYVKVGAIGLDEEFGLETALLQYVEAGDATAAQRLLQAGANPNARHAPNGTALLAAIDNNDVADVRVLLAAHADPNLAADNVPVFDAVDPATAKQPANQKFGPTEDAPPINDGHIYAADRQLIVTALAGAGASLDVRDERTYTPLMIAAATGQCDLVAALVLAGADQTLHANSGETALEWAQSEGHPDCVPLLQRGPGATARAQGLIAQETAEHPPWASRDQHLEGTASLRERQAQAQLAEVARLAPRGWSASWLGGLFSNLLWSLIVSTLTYFAHRLWRFLRGDHRPVRWAFIPVSSGSYSGGSDNGGSDENADDGPSHGGASGGGGASRDF